MFSGALLNWHTRQQLTRQCSLPPGRACCRQLAADAVGQFSLQRNAAKNPTCFWMFSGALLNWQNQHQYDKQGYSRQLQQTLSDDF